MNERIEANMLPDMCRTEYIIHEMRFQRHALLGSLAVWKQQMVQYYQDIQMWRMNRNARELMQDVLRPNFRKTVTQQLLSQSSFGSNFSTSVENFTNSSYSVSQDN